MDERLAEVDLVVQAGSDEDGSIGGKDADIVDMVLVSARRHKVSDRKIVVIIEDRGIVVAEKRVGRTAGLFEQLVGHKRGARLPVSVVAVIVSDEGAAVHAFDIGSGGGLQV